MNHMPNTSLQAGTHICADMWGCDAALLNDEAFLTSVLTRAAEKAGSTILGKLSYAFEPQGITAILLLAESHISIHTWPEEAFCAVDIYTCGDRMEPVRAFDEIRDELRATKIELQTLQRGVMRNE